MAMLLIKSASVLAARVSDGGRRVNTRIVIPSVAARRWAALAIRFSIAGLDGGEGRSLARAVYRARLRWMRGYTRERQRPSRSPSPKPTGRQGACRGRGPWIDSCRSVCRSH